MFKAVITEETTTMNGTIKERLAGFICYIDALLDMGISSKTIKEVVELALKDKDNDDIKIQKYDLSNMSKEEAKDLIEKEIFKMFD